eukprot:gene57656-biopygen116030
MCTTMFCVSRVLETREWARQKAAKSAMYKSAVKLKHPHDPATPAHLTQEQQKQIGPYIKMLDTFQGDITAQQVSTEEPDPATDGWELAEYVDMQPQEDEWLEVNNDNCVQCPAKATTTCGECCNQLCRTCKKKGCENCGAAQDEGTGKRRPRNQRAPEARGTTEWHGQKRAWMTTCVKKEAGLPSKPDGSSTTGGIPHPVGLSPAQPAPWVGILRAPHTVTPPPPPPPPPPPVLGQLWISSGPVLDQFWASSGPALVQFWTSSGPVLVQLWASSGPVLDQPWTSSGPALGQFWTSSGPALDQFWASSGPVL